VTAKSKIEADEVYASDGIATVDGVRVAYTVGGSRPEPDVGWTGGVEIDFDANQCILYDLAAWESAHPGIEPTRAAMVALIEGATDDIIAHATDDAAEQAFDAPDRDDGDY
jgi:hypothetical protein